MRRAVLVSAFILAGACSRQPVAPDDAGADELRTPVAIDLGLDTGLGQDVTPPVLDGDPWAPDLNVEGPYVDLSYDRSVTLPNSSPGFSDAKLSDLSLIFTDWAYGKEAVHCEADLKPYQLADLLAAAAKVDWGGADKLGVCGSGSAASQHALWLLLTAKQGQPVGVKTTWCDDDPSYPPADLQAFLVVMKQVESTVCGFPPP
jgi:hypothetical protein